MEEMRRTHSLRVFQVLIHKVWVKDYDLDHIFVRTLYEIPTLPDNIKGFHLKGKMFLINTDTLKFLRWR